MAIIWTPSFARLFDPASEILLEMFEPENVAVDEALVESLPHQTFQVAHAKHCNGTLPADPGIALCLRSHFHKSVSKKSACKCPIEFSPHSEHREGFPHARSNEFFGVPVHDDFVERLWVAIEYRCHNTVACCGDS